MSIYVFRLGHRPFRDQRITTHCALVARAFGAKGMYYSGQKDQKLEESIRKAVSNWGGIFRVEYAPKWKSTLNLLKRKGLVLHLTVYGIPFNEKIGEIKREKRDLTLVIGGEKVPSEVYDMADYNLSVNNQPHSEVAALAVFLHEYFKGKELNKEFKNAKMRIIPQERGKNVIKT